ncbi:xanthine dehydrogenase family protein molybdopterin-binding subunit [Myxococcota bacterium]|nr:xanthine dehydrogenase family protein molybdopterin-binding subunit [Myxococcota bacterium]
MLEPLSRRRFLAVSGGGAAGLMLSFSLPLESLAREVEVAQSDEPNELNAWVRVSEDGSVSFSVSEIEMGQGVFTAIPMILAEELEVDWESIQVEQASVDPRFGRQLTGGSQSIRHGFDSFRKAGAAAREMLIAAAAGQWGVEAKECRAERGVVHHSPSGREASYGQLAARAATLPPPQDPPLKDRSDYRIIGQRIPRLDTPSKVEGKAVYGLDVRVEGMRVAQVERPPTLGASVESFDAAQALKVTGVEQVVEIPSGVAVVARSTWPAKKGRDRLKVEWTPGQVEVSDDSILASCRESLDGGIEVRNEGDAEAALRDCATSLEATYTFPYLAHATMEPMNCTAHVTEDRCEVWAPTQSLSSTQAAAARTSGMPLERVVVHPTFLGGGFGRRSATDFVEDAVSLSKAVGQPVQVVYSREDDMRAGFYRPVGYNELAGGLDADGQPVAWRHRMASPSILREKGWPMRQGVDFAAVEGARNLPYAIPNLSVSWSDVDLPISTHFWRSVGSSHNAWVTECFFDELCAAGGRDPLEARLKLLDEHPRHQRVLRVAGEKAGWGGSLPEGHARGVAVHEAFGSFVAQVAEVSIGPGGRPSVERVVCAIDCGDVVNPDTVEAQMEGGIAFGLSAALHGAVHFDQGRVVSGNFDGYPLLRMAEMPRVETYIATAGDPLGGVGEPGTPPIAPAVCNALLALTGKPVRSLPIGSVA